MAITNMCVGCNSPINDMYHLIVGNQFFWHLGCLKCTVCNCLLQMESKCFMNNGKFYCTEDYNSLYKQNQNSSLNILKDKGSDSIESCRKCLKHISPNEYVINISDREKSPDSTGDLTSNLYHSNCFMCTECNNLILPGHPYGIFNQDIYCHHHFINKLNNPQPQYTVLDSLNNQHSSNDSQRIKTSQPMLNTSQNMMEHNLLPISSRMSSSMSSSSSTSSSSLSPNQKIISNPRGTFKQKSEYSSGNCSNSHQQNNYLISKKKRVRTSFKHQQLRIMKAHFQINQNPDSKDLKELSERTGLQKRVLQVWFQNSRAKQRKTTGPCGMSIGQLGSMSSSGHIGQSGVSADSSMNLDEEEIYSDDEQASDDESSSDIKTECIKDEQQFQHHQLIQNNLVDFYHF